MQSLILCKFRRKCPLFDLKTRPCVDDGAFCPTGIYSEFSVVLRHCIVCRKEVSSRTAILRRRHKRQIILDGKEVHLCGSCIRRYRHLDDADKRELRTIIKAIGAYL